MYKVTRYVQAHLHMIKREHELWVEQQLSDKEARDEVADEIYATLIDACVEYGDLALELLDRMGDQQQREMAC